MVGDMGMEQTKVESHIETSADMTLGFCVSWLVMLWVIPLFYPEYESTARTSFGFVMIFTVSSYIRRYFTRRYFARGFHLVLHKIISRFFI